MRRIITSVLLAALAAIVPIGLAGPAGAGSGDPERIVSLSPTATEMLFAIGAGSDVVAVDDQSDFPEAAPTTDLSGYEPNLEAIAGYEPDLVVLDSDAIAGQLEDLGIEVLVLPAATVLDDTYEQIEQLGEVTGRAKRAARLVRTMRSDIDGLLDRVPDDDPAPTAYYELDETYFSADSTTFIGKLLQLAGFENIADEAAGDGSGYPQLSAEFVIESDPEVIFLADTECCKQSAETVADRPGFDGLQAVDDGNVVELDDDVASRWGPRVVKLLRTLVRARNRV